ncbi:hypothetical protein NHQ30_011569 [Ciborinia camelliae]|nr:hypothetical protein NHQ30_011569 [Ciborinia camelliae]
MVLGSEVIDDDEVWSITIGDNDGKLEKSMAKLQDFDENGGDDGENVCKTKFGRQQKTGWQIVRKARYTSDFDISRTTQSVLQLAFE